MAAGSRVVAHEGPGLAHVACDVEPASAKGFGVTPAELLAQEMGGEGEYAVFGGSPTVPPHNARADCAIADPKENCPNIERIGERYGAARRGHTG